MRGACASSTPSFAAPQNASCSQAPNITMYGLTVFVEGSEWSSLTGKVCSPRPFRSRPVTRAGLFVTGEIMSTSKAASEIALLQEPQDVAEQPAVTSPPFAVSLGVAFPKVVLATSHMYHR